jgi:hypothetical protein
VGRSRYTLARIRSTPARRGTIFRTLKIQQICQVPVSAFQLADCFSRASSPTTSPSTSTDECRVLRMLPLKNATVSFPRRLRETCFATHKQHSCFLTGVLRRIGMIVRTAQGQASQVIKSRASLRTVLSTPL